MPIKYDENFIEKILNKKIRFAVIIIALTFSLIFFRLFYLQILKGFKYNELSSNNRIRVSNIHAPRGLIISKNEEILVQNIPSFDLNLIPQDTPDLNVILKDISVLLNLNLENLKKKAEKKRGRPPFEPITLKKELTWHEMSLVLSKKMGLKGISIDVVQKRLYSLGRFAPHVFGFLGEINRDELKSFKRNDYSIGDLVGKYGLEKWGEKYFRGKKGGVQTEVDVYGNKQKTLFQIDPVPGCNLVVSLDPVLQKVAENLLGEQTGAIVAIDPRNGEIKVLASSPSYDSNLFARGIDTDEWKKLINNQYHPLLNRSIQSQQPPGSIFKVITAIALLEEKSVDPALKINCPGSLKLGNRVFHCWKTNGHGQVDLYQAIVESCDCYFYTVGLRVGIENIVKYSEMFGIGKRTGVELDDEKKGLLPTPGWKEKTYGSPWQKGETYNISIGQGLLLTTPIQLASVFCGIANGGIIPKPRLVLKLICGDLEKKTFPPQPLKRFELSSETITFIKKSLVGVVNDPKGTGLKSKINGILVAGKTGTAQVVSKRTTEDKDEDIPWPLRDHAWFVGFAPSENPEIVVSVLIEHGGSGGKIAAPIAREIIKKCLIED